MPGSWRAASPGTEGRERKGLRRSANTEKLRQARTDIPRHMHVHAHTTQTAMDESAAYSWKLGVCRGRRRGNSVDR